MSTLSLHRRTISGSQTLSAEQIKLIKAAAPQALSELRIDVTEHGAARDMRATFTTGPLLSPAQFTDEESGTLAPAGPSPLSEKDQQEALLLRESSAPAQSTWAQRATGSVRSALSVGQRQVAHVDGYIGALLQVGRVTPALRWVDSKVGLKTFLSSVGRVSDSHFHVVLDTMLGFGKYFIDSSTDHLLGIARDQAATHLLPEHMANLYEGWAIYQAPLEKSASALAFACAHTLAQRFELSPTARERVCALSMVAAGQLAAFLMASEMDRAAPATDAGASAATI
ncbi:hypothetical protein [Novosphingobium sp.]|uniref:hypothetical protein n=1 Tax=Novosphingobium sp. TaxID=1874826 RepID=UPI003D151042